jgi:peptidyl-prolyl cis-trans isomerase C
MPLAFSLAEPAGVALPRAAWVVFLVLVVATAGCPADPRSPPRPPVATVGGMRIEESRVLAVLAQRGVARVADPAARKLVTEEIVSSLIEEELLLQAAERAGIVVTPEAVEREMRRRAEGYPPGTFQRVLTQEQLTLAAFRDSIRRRLAADAFLRSHFATLAAPTEVDIAARYAATPERWQRPAEVRARQVFLRTREEAQHLLDEIRNGRLSVEQAARRFSAGLEADKGGDLGWFARGEMPDAFDVCFSLERGRVSDVVASDDGFHLFQVLDTRDAHVLDVTHAREHIVDDLLRERHSAATTALLASLKAATVVVIAADGIDRLVSLLPPAPVTPTAVLEQGGRALDSHEDGEPSLLPRASP